MTSGRRPRALLARPHGQSPAGWHLHREQRPQLAGCDGSGSRGLQRRKGRGLGGCVTGRGGAEKKSQRIAAQGQVRGGSPGSVVGGRGPPPETAGGEDGGRQRARRQERRRCRGEGGGVGGAGERRGRLAGLQERGAHRVCACDAPPPGAGRRAGKVHSRRAAGSESRPLVQCSRPRWGGRVMEPSERP